MAHAARKFYTDSSQTPRLARCCERWLPRERGRPTPLVAELARRPTARWPTVRTPWRRQQQPARLPTARPLGGGEQQPARGDQQLGL